MGKKECGRRKRGSPAGNKSQAGAHQMKDEDIVDGPKPTASSHVNENGRTAMGQLVKVTALLCFVYDVDYRNFVDGHEVDIGEDPSGTFDFVLTHPL